MRGRRPKLFLPLHGLPFEAIVYLDAVVPDKYFAANIACIPSLPACMPILPVGAEGKKDKEGGYSEPEVIG